MNMKLLSMVRFYFAQSAFMTSCHYAAYERLKKVNTNKNYCLKGGSILTIILLILQIIGFKSGSINLLELLSYSSILLTGISLIFAFAMKEETKEIIFQHKYFAEKYKNLRDDYMNLIEKIISNCSDDNSLRTISDNLQNRYSSLGENAPSTNDEDYKKAQSNLGVNANNKESFTWSNKEIDRFLPEQLKFEKLRHGIV